ncbi:hypothetical protein FNF29_02256 [Cafeteria roenbergensis]|uniref:Uncharacterized protein n=1 Tax=Cafeteria roenbergensis TaxID=33653 RepID=A0A5A8CQC2_CAFRO|nr:hypothetical protein FNF29_02256 [Cafeteria roenbergensis]|eukprot:KAA0154727.1 hypothetical protein FNF29_02256 [Cafeteria roenbergensis]
MRASLARARPVLGGLRRTLVTEGAAKAGLSFWESPFLGPIRMGDAIVVTTTTLIGIGAYYMAQTAPERDVGELQDLLGDRASQHEFPAPRALAVLARGRTPAPTAFETLCILAEQLAARGESEGAARLLGRAQEALAEAPEPGEGLCEEEREFEGLRRTITAQSIALQMQQALITGSRSQDADAAGVVRRGSAKVASAAWACAKELEALLPKIEATGSNDMRVAAAALRRLALVVSASAAATQHAAEAVAGTSEPLPPSANTPPSRADASRLLRLARESDAARGVPSIAPGPVGLQFTLGLTSALGRTAPFAVLIPAIPVVEGEGETRTTKFVRLGVWDGRPTEEAVRG